MRFMYFVQSGNSVPPTQALQEAIGRVTDREVKAGRLVDAAGLQPLDKGARVQLKGGKLGVLDGPFAESKEVVGGYAIFELPGKDEAVALAVEFMSLHKEFCPGWEGTCEVRAFEAPPGQ